MVALRYNYKEVHFDEFCSDLMEWKEEGQFPLVFAPDSDVAQQIAAAVDGVAIVVEMDDDEWREAFLKSEKNVLILTDKSVPTIETRYDTILSYSPPTGYYSEVLRHSLLAPHGRHLVYLLL
ncbi:MAG: hypothetical protein GY737_09390 [Desulfobacteraceae bacterium]|nr:hypothetical protein [Desulfobacteraceae bacterium]